MSKEAYIQKQVPIINEIVNAAVKNILIQTGVKLNFKITDLEIGEISDSQILEVIFKACNIWQTPYSVITIRNRKREIIAQRQCITLLIYTIYNSHRISLKRMAQLTGLTDHSSFIHNLKEANKHLGVSDKIFMSYWLPIKHLLYEAEAYK